MPESVYKVIELIGTSKESWEKAAAAAVERAGKIAARSSRRRSRPARSATRCQGQDRSLPRQAQRLVQVRGHVERPMDAGPETRSRGSAKPVVRQSVRTDASPRHEARESMASRLNSSSPAGSRPCRADGTLRRRERWRSACRDPTRPWILPASSPRTDTCRGPCGRRSRILPFLAKKSLIGVARICAITFGASSVPIASIAFR